MLQQYLCVKLPAETPEAAAACVRGFTPSPHHAAYTNHRTFCHPDVANCVAAYKATKELQAAATSCPRGFGGADSTVAALAIVRSHKQGLMEWVALLTGATRSCVASGGCRRRLPAPAACTTPDHS